MEEKTVLEKLKEQEYALNAVAEAFGFSFMLTLHSKESATLKTYLLGKKITNFEILNVKVKSQLLLTIEKNNELITDTLYCKNFLVFIYNYLNYKDVEFFYQFNGGIYHNQMITESELSQIADVSMKNLRKKYLSIKDEFENQPVLSNYKKAFCSGLDYGIIFFVYDSISE